MEEGLAFAVRQSPEEFDRAVGNVLRREERLTVVFDIVVQNQNGYEFAGILRRVFKWKRERRREECKRYYLLEVRIEMMQ